MIRWTALGVILTALAANRAGIPALVWVAPTPFLVVAARVTGARGWLGLGAALAVAMGLATAKIVTDPVSPVMVPLFALPMAFAALGSLALWRLARDRAGAVAALYAWPALTALTDWLGYAHSDLSA